MPLKTKYEHIHFVKTKSKEVCYFMFSNTAFLCMGMVRYHKPWKRYVVDFERMRIFDHNCLRDIADFLDQLNECKKLKGNNEK